MTDDQLFFFVDDFMNNVIDRDTFLKICKFRYATHQISFHTVQALGCLTFDETGSELIKEFKISKGNFDAIGNYEGNVPLPIHVARTYKSLIVNIAKTSSDNIEKIIYDVFTSFISKEISDFNTSTFFENPSYIYESYLAGELLD